MLAAKHNKQNFDFFSRVLRMSPDNYMVCEKIQLFNYEPDYLKLNWAVVGIFNVRGRKRNDELEKCVGRFKKSEIRGKGIVSGDTMVTFTRDMWLV